MRLGLRALGLFLLIGMSLPGEQQTPPTPEITPAHVVDDLPPKRIIEASPSAATEPRDRAISAPRPRKVRTGTVAISESLLACIRRFESGGDYGAVSKSGAHLGAYQVSRSSFINNFGTDDPSKVSPARQDALARDYLRRRGLSPWPVPGVRCKG